MSGIYHFIKPPVPKNGLNKYPVLPFLLVFHSSLRINKVDTYIAFNNTQKKEVSLYYHNEISLGLIEFVQLSINAFSNAS